MREIVKALPLGLGLPVIIGAASVKPQDAASNLAAWIEVLGFHNLPQWVTSPSADKYVIAATLCAGAIYSIAVWGPYRRKMVHSGGSMHTWGPWLLIIGGPFAGLIWMYLSLPRVSLATTPAASTTAENQPVQTEHERQQKLLDELTDKLIAERPELQRNPDAAVAWLNAQLEVRGEGFRWHRARPSGLSNLTVIGNGGDGAFMKSEGATVLNENLIIKNFKTGFIVKGGSITNRNVEAVAPETNPLSEDKK